MNWSENYLALLIIAAINMESIGSIVQLHTLLFWDLEQYYEEFTRNIPILKMSSSIENCYVEIDNWVS